ncbi:MAG TPA: DNA/RNA non-specific endonuclease, partial [Kofleriaceae bacterium]|nr:DNA/RNA non-specific endonuclease [Kofleriaceae bacterium]
PDGADAGPRIDAGSNQPDPPGPDGIAGAIAAADGDGLALGIHSATVTYLKPQIGSVTSDPAGFTIQATRAGAALFVAVDPATLTPPAAVGDVVSFTITSKHTVSRQPRAMAIASYARSATGADVGALTQDLSAATDVVTAIDHYDSELVTITGTLTAAPSSGGTGFERATISTAGIAIDPNFQLRMPVTVIDAIDMVGTCQFTVSRVPMGQFNTQAQIAAFNASDIQLHNCPAPTVMSVNATSATTLVLTLSRNILPGSVRADGSQFTFNGGLVATRAAVSGRTITITTTAQVGATPYTTTIARTVTDLQGAAISGIAMFPGFGGGGGGSNGAALSVHTTLGIPGSITTTAPSDYFVSVKPLYVVSYNATRKVPNWVSWELNTSYLGSTDRQDDYRPDDTFPITEPQASLADYSGSGYERGHMCPSADRTLDAASNMQTFYLTNMVPQAANNNEGPWADLENYARSLAGTGKELFIISGGTFSATSKLVGANMVVPDETFKVIVVLDAVGQGVSSVTTSTRVIAVLMPNDNGLINKTDDWHNFRVSVDTIEAMTGYDFLSDVDPSIQAVIEARVDNQP